MSSYKSSLSRAKQQPTSESNDSKYRQQAQQLQELFPTWSNEGPISKVIGMTPILTFHLPDLQTLLAEVSGDVQVAATRISEGAVPLLYSFTYEN